MYLCNAPYMYQIDRFCSNYQQILLAFSFSLPIDYKMCTKKWWW